MPPSLDAQTYPARLNVCVHAPVQVGDVRALFQYVDRAVTDLRNMQVGSVARLLWQRHERASTALGQGVALPRASVRNLPCPRLVYVKLAEPIDMNAPDGQPVSEVLTLLVRYPASPLDHLMLDRLQDATLLRRLLELLRKSRCTEAAMLLLRLG